MLLIKNKDLFNMDIFVLLVLFYTYYQKIGD